VQGFEFFETLWQDIRYGFRLMARTPVFTAIAVITLALGIGANTAVFSLMNAVMFRVLPVQDPAELMMLHWSANKSPRFNWYANYGDTKRGNLRGSNPGGESFSHPFLEEVEKSSVFSGVAAFAGGGQLTMSGDGPATSVNSQAVNGDFFRTLGIRAAAGRLLEPGDDQPSSAPVAVLNYGYWQRVYGGSPTAIGKVVNLNGVSFTIVGVAERKFVSLSLGNVYDLWLPMAIEPQLEATFGPRHNDPAASWLLIAARLRPGTPIAQQQAAMDVLFRNDILHGSKPLAEEVDAPRITLLQAQDALIGSSGQFTDPLRVLMVAVGIVLLIACANVAGLVLSKATARTREIALRLALGARRSRLLRQLLTESVIMAVIGGALGIAMAFWGAHAIVAMVAGNRTRPLGFTAVIDGRVLAFTSAISLLTGILFGFAPALRSLRVDLTPALKEGSGASSGKAESRRRWYSMSNALVVLQAALAMVVLMGAGLLVHTLTNLRNLNPGFDTRNTLTFGLSPKLAGYKDPQVDNLYRELQQQIGALPGVAAVSYSQAPLLSGSWMRTRVKNLPPGSDKKLKIEVSVMPVGLGFFDTLKIPLLTGRALNQADIELGAAKTAVPMPVVVNQILAHKFFPGRNVLGQQFGENDGSDPEQPQKSPGYVIVGVAQDAKYNNLRQEIEPTMYIPLTGQNAAFEVRTAGDPKAMVPAIRDVVNQHNSNLPMINVLTETEQIDRLLEQERLIAKLSSFFGILALLLASLGLYGLLSYEVTRRTREIGIRMALGARRADLIRMVVWQGIALAAIGTALGLAVAMATGHLLATFLYGVKPSDPVTLISVTLLLIIVALMAASVPARRATTVDPMVALRYE